MLHAILGHPVYSRIYVSNGDWSAWKWSRKDWKVNNLLWLADCSAFGCSHFIIVIQSSLENRFVVLIQSQCHMLSSCYVQCTNCKINKFVNCYISTLSFCSSLKHPMKTESLLIPAKALHSFWSELRGVETVAAGKHYFEHFI